MTNKKKKAFKKDSVKNKLTRGVFNADVKIGVKKCYPISINKIFITKSTTESKKLGKFLSEEILRNSRFLSDTIILGLKGDLGGGKTTFLQGFAKGLKIKQKILSPTFVIIRKYRIPNHLKRIGYHKYTNFYHLDCYRLKGSQDAVDLGIKKLVHGQEPKIIAIEWADRIKKILPKNILDLDFIFISKNIRKIIIE